MKSRILLASSLCFLLVGWSSPVPHPVAIADMTTDKTGVQPDAMSNNADMALLKQVTFAVKGDTSSPKIDLTLVTFTAKDGAVTIRGKVKDESQKAALTSKVNAVPGVKSVDNQVEVSSS